LHRPGRSASGLTALFVGLIARMVDLVSVKDGSVLRPPGGRLIGRLAASVAALQTEVRRARIAAGQAVARANGKTWGGSEKGRRIKVEAEQERMIRTMRAAGEKIAAIARATGLTRPTVYDVLAG